MSKFSFRLTLLFSLAFFLNSQAQSLKCGLPDPAEVTRQMLENREEMRDFVFDRSAVTHVPVRIYLVAKTDGTGRPSERLGLRLICNLNDVYADQDIQFYLKEFKYPNNTNIYSNPMDAWSALKSQVNSNYNAINIFIVDDIGGSAGGGIVAAYYQPPATGQDKADWLVTMSDYADASQTLAHEVGHFFSLPHPFNGWDHDPWDASLHGNPVSSFYAPDGETLNEFVDGSNCQTAGDYICDTPADYNFGLSSNTCVYNQNAKDPKGDLLNPDEKNIMNYFDNCSQYYFSEGQKAEVQNSLFSNSRNYVRPNYTPDLTAVEGPATLLSPATGATIESYNYVVLQWSKVPGATRYLVEVNQLGGGYTRYLTNDTLLILNALVANKSYFWKVLPFNESQTCESYSTSKSFKTGGTFTATFEIEGLEKWSVQPNPVRTSGVVTVNVEAASGITASVNLMDLNGRLVRSVEHHRFPGGSSSLEIPVEQLAPGIYLVALQTVGSVETKRIAVVE